MFLFFSFPDYYPSGGTGDLIGKAETDTWAELVDLLDKNRVVNDNLPVGEGDLRDYLSETVQVLNVDTLERKEAAIEAARDENDVWRVSYFEPLDDATEMLAGIPYVKPAPKPVPPPPPVPTIVDYLYYEVDAHILIRRNVGAAVEENHHFTFMCKRLKSAPFANVMRNEAVTDLAVSTFLFRHALRLNNRFGLMGCWITQMASCRFMPVDEYCPSQAEFAALPENQEGARSLANPTYRDQQDYAH